MTWRLGKGPPAQRVVFFTLEDGALKRTDGWAIDFRDPLTSWAVHGSIDPKDRTGLANREEALADLLADMIDAHRRNKGGFPSTLEELRWHYRFADFEVRNGPERVSFTIVGGKYKIVARASGDIFVYDPARRRGEVQYIKGPGVSPQSRTPQSQ